MNTTNCKKFKAEKAIKVNKMVLFLLSKFNLSVIPAKAGIRAPGSRRNLGGESPPPGDVRSW